MIDKLVLKNFLSYEDETVQFSGSTIAVVGENGHGKSAFLEAIPYAYYGIGREDKAGMSRIMGDGSHRVEIWQGTTMICRGRKAGGAGFCEVRIDGVLKAKGQEADAWIIEYLGMDGDTFMLTAFFGLSDTHSDKLLKVVPSARLESLQSLAKVGIYRRLLTLVKNRSDVAERLYATEFTRIEGIKQGMGDMKALTEGLSAGHKYTGDLDTSLLELKATRRDLQIKEESYQAFVKEKERVSVERKNLRISIEKLDKERDMLVKDIELDMQSIVDEQFKLEEFTKTLDLMDVPELEATVKKVQTKFADAKASMELKSAALNTTLGERVECPLCGQPVTQDIMDTWETSVSELRKLMDELIQEGESTDRSLGAFDSLEDNIEHLDKSIKDLNTEVIINDKRVNAITKEVKKLDSELKKQDDRFILLAEKLGDEYQGLQASLQDIASSIDDNKAKKNRATGEMTGIKQAIERNKAGQLAITSSQKILDSTKLDITALKLLKQAWSRYGIPLQLIRDVSKKIETRASKVYQEFDNGRIEVKEIEDRGKPGVQFYLVDRKGDRTYNQLSMGEKVMFYISVRVAVAQIVAEGNDLNVDMLILDESLANLSPKSRDNLIRLISKVLRKIFPQLILVSHTVMQDIFSQTIRISAEDGTSHVEVV